MSTVASEPTNRQLRMWAYVLEFQASNGVPPTVREIGDALGLKSPNGVMCHLKALVKKGYMRKRLAGTSRGFVAIARPNEDESCACCPTCGRRIEDQGTPNQEVDRGEDQ